MISIPIKNGCHKTFNFDVDFFGHVDRFFVDFGSQNPSKINKKSIKNGHQNRSKFCMRFEWPFGGSWGQHGPKPLPKALPMPGKKCSLVGSWEGLGGLLGPLGASWGPRANFIGFLSIFDRFLSIFCTIFG